MIMELGGNINLDGFDNLDKSKLLVVKKIVGHAVKDLSEQSLSLENVSVIFNGSEDAPAISVNITCCGQVFSGSETGTNLFFALDSALKNACVALKEMK